MLSRRIFLPLPVLLFLLLVLTAPADAQSVNIAGDANGDTAVNVQDVQVIINQALATSPPTPAGDPNRDGTVNVQDVQLTINLALGQFVVAAVDPAIAPVTAPDYPSPGMPVENRSSLLTSSILRRSGITSAA